MKISSIKKTRNNKNSKTILTRSIHNLSFFNPYLPELSELATSFIRKFRILSAKNLPWSHLEEKEQFTKPRTKWPNRRDPLPDDLRAHTCSRCARITWFRKNFEHTVLWTMVCNLFDQRLFRSGTV